MKLRILFVLFIIFPHNLLGKIELAKKNGYYCNDGDTCYVNVWYEDLNRPIREKIRVIGLDTPEIYRPKCDFEKTIGLKAKEFINFKILNSKEIKLITDYNRDNFGRILVTIIIDNENISDLIISNGLGVPYSKKNKFNWCSSSKNN